MKNKPLELILKKNYQEDNMRKIAGLLVLLLLASSFAFARPSQDGNVITYYGFSEWTASEPFAKAYAAAKAQFEAENPGFKVELQSDPWGDWEPKYKTMFASGNPADVFIVNNPDFPTFANSGNLLDLDRYVQRGFFNGYFPGVQAMYQWQGSNRAIAFTTDTRVLWYNKELFAQAGLPDRAPETWAELLSFAMQIRERTGRYGFGMDLGLTEFPVQSLYCASGSAIIKVDNSGRITPNADTPEFRAFLQLLIDLKPTFQPDFATMNHHDVANMFAQGQYGIIIGNVLSETDIYTKNFWGQGLVPRMNTSVPNGSFGGGFGIAVSSRTKHPEQAVRFAQLLTSARYNGDLVSDSPATAAGAAATYGAPQYRMFAEQIQYARQPQPKTLYYSEIDRACYDTIVEVLVGGISVNEAVTRLTNRINQIVR